MTADTIRIKGKPFAVRRVTPQSQHARGPLVVYVVPCAAAPCLAERHPWAVAPAVQAAGDD